MLLTDNSVPTPPTHTQFTHTHTETEGAVPAQQLLLKEAGFDDRLKMGLRRKNSQVHSGSFRFWLRRFCGQCCSDVGAVEEYQQGRAVWLAGQGKGVEMRNFDEFKVSMDIQGGPVGFTVWSLRGLSGWESQSYGWRQALWN